MISRLSKKQLLDACFQSLARFSIQKKFGVGLFPIGTDYIGWVGLNIGVHADYLRINPNIGIHCVPVMRLLAQVRGDNYKEGSDPTYAVPIGVLCPDDDQFIVRTEICMNGEVARLSKMIQQYAKPYMESLSDLSTLTALVRERTGQFGGYPEIYAICLHMSGADVEALAFLSSQIAANQSANLGKFNQTLEKLQSYLNAHQVNLN